jgi:hypothetical protein
MYFKNYEKVDNYFKARQADHFSSPFLYEELTRVPYNHVNTYYLQDPETFEKKKSKKPLSELISYFFSNDYFGGVFSKSSDLP